MVWSVLIILVCVTAIVRWLWLTYSLLCYDRKDICKLKHPRIILVSSQVTFLIWIGLICYAINPVCHVLSLFIVVLGHLKCYKHYVCPHP